MARSSLFKLRVHIVPVGFEIDRVICTPHLGASTLEAQTNVAVQVAEQIIAYLKKGTVINAVNVPPVTEADGVVIDH